MELLNEPGEGPLEAPNSPPPGSPAKAASGNSPAALNRLCALIARPQRPTAGGGAQRGSR